VCKTLCQLERDGDKISDTNVVFQKDVFLIPGVKITKGPQASIAKPVTAFPKFVYITIKLLD